jgi:hypothetical protein
MKRHTFLIESEILEYSISISNEQQNELIDQIDLLCVPNYVNSNVNCPRFPGYKIWKKTSSFNSLLKNILEIFKGNPYHYSENYFIQEAWCVKYIKKCYTRPHQHLPRFYSFVYYIKSSENSSPIIFGNYNHILYPKTGDLIFFPSIVTHSVPPNSSDSDRYILAGNISEIIDYE